MERGEQILRELRYSLRTLRREPLFVLGVICTFALSIGTNAAMLGLVTRLMLSPPPGIRDPEQVARIQIERVAANGETFAMSSMSYPAFEALRGQKRAFSTVAAVRTDSVAIGRGSETSQAAALQATGDYFQLLGVIPALGRFYGPADDVLPLGNQVVVLGYAFWKSHFAGARNVLGRELIIDDQPFTIVGVAPRGFNGETLSSVELFMPLSAAMRNNDFGWWTNDRINLLSTIVRLAPGVNAGLASELATSVLIEPRTFADSDRRPVARLDAVTPGAASRQSPQARIAIWLSGVSLIVLLIATANVGTLLLLRAAKRRRDFAVRIALGADRVDFARQMLVESMLLALVGAAAGLVLSHWFEIVLRNTLLPNVAAGDRFVDRRVLLASIVTATLAGALAGLAPLAQLRRTNISEDLRGGHSAFQNVLIGLQVALCTVLLIGAGLFVRSLQRVQAQDLGFSTSNLLVVTLHFRVHMPGADRDLAHYDALRALRGVAGVARATVVQAMPFGSFHVPPLSIPGLPSMPTIAGQPPFMYGATTDYLQMMRVTAQQGRLFSQYDTRNSPLVVLVNASMARHLWPGQNAIGKCVRAGYGPGASMGFGEGNPAETAPCREVVGVVRDSRARSLRPDGNEAKYMQFYVPFEQLPIPPAPNYAAVNGILVQVAPNADGMSAAIQRIVQSGEIPLYARVRHYQDLIDPQLRSWRLGAALFLVFSALALGIAAVGLFGVISYVVSQRTREMGVRVALGATRSLLWRMVVRDAIRLVAIGIAIGCVGALIAGPLVRELLFQTHPWEPANLLVAAVVLVSVTVVAAIWPAWRAGRVSPLVALRIDD